MKRIIAIIAAMFIAVSLAACGNNSQVKSEETQNAAEEQIVSSESTSTAKSETSQMSAKQESEAQEAAMQESETSETLVHETSSEEAESAAEVLSSVSEEQPGGISAPAEHSEILVAYFSATGTTKGVAEKLATVTGGDLYEILAAEPYSTDDLNYNDSSSRTTLEQNDKAVRPAIGSEDISLEGYTTIYLGFPIWWGEEPRILDTFVEKYDFDGITVIPFCTSSSSGIGRSGPNMEALAGSGIWLEGKRFSGGATEEELQSWIIELK